jgi:hypothetical protein
VTQLLLLLTAAGLVCLGTFVLVARPQNVINICFAAYTTCLIAWTVSIAGVHSVDRS